MRPDSPTPRSDRSVRTAGPLVAAGLPVAVLGSIALALTTAPSHVATMPAAARDTDVQPFKALPSTLIAAPATTAALVSATAVGSAAAVPTTYTVQAGDTVISIASRHGIRTADVLALNGLGWRSVIYPGQVLRLTAGAAAAPTTPPPASTPASGTHTVGNGDTISSIAKRHGVTTQAVLAANGLSWSSVIYPGQKIAIPGAAAAAPSAPSAPAPLPSTGTYTISAGDTITAIARRHGVTPQAVLSANGLSPSSIIYPGQKIAIPAAPVAASAPSVPGLTAEQVANAQLIVRIGRELGVPDRGIAIALGTAMQESWIRNLDWGDRDSLGLFQQRPSHGWGTPEQIKDPARAIKVFYGGPSDPNGGVTRGLLDIPGWQAMSFMDAAQAVQISAYPDRYAQWEGPAHAWLAALG